jgi:hypothetical protein
MVYARSMEDAREWGPEEWGTDAPVRRGIAVFLCWLGKALVSVLAVLSGLGLTVVIIVGTIKGSISVIGAILLTVFGVPIVGTLAYWLALLLGMPLLGIATLIHRNAVSEWLDRQPLTDDELY